MSIEERVKKLLVNNAELSKGFDEITNDEDLSLIGMNSITYIKIIVAIEDEFDIEINDEDLDYRMFGNINKISELIKEMLKESGKSV